MTGTTVSVETPGVPALPPTGPIPFARLLRVEWQKTVGTRAARWLLGAVVALTAGGLAIPLAFPRDVSQSRASYLSCAALGETRLLPIVLLMALSGEWSQRTALVTFTQEPRRGRVLAAKIAAGSGIALVFAVFGWALTQAVVGVAAAAGRSIASHPPVHGPQLAGYAVFVLLTSLIGMAFGALAAGTATAIVSYVALGALGNLFSIGPLRDLGRWVNTGETYGWLLHGEWAGHTAQIATSTTLWLILPLALGLVRTLRREIR